MQYSTRQITVNLLAMLAITSSLLIGCGKMPGPDKKKARARSSVKPFSQEVAADAFASVDEAIQKLIELAEAGQINQQDRAASWLSKQGEAVVPPLSKILSDESRSEKARIAACQVLAEIGPAARAVLLKTTDSPTKMVRISATVRLGRIQPADQLTIDRLISLLKHADKTTCRAAAVSLGSIGSVADSATESLTTIYLDQQADELLRNAAFSSLKKIHPRRDFTDLLDGSN
jgi:HEAT repeat protein